MMATLALVWALGVAIVSLVAVSRQRTSPLGARRPPGRAILLRPCAGLEPGLARALASSIVAREIDARVRFAIATVDDPAGPVAERAAAELRAAGLDASVIVTATEAENAKCGQLAAAIARDDSTLVVVADSDVTLSEGDLVGLVAPLADGHAAAWAPPIESAPARTLGDHASQALLAASLHSFPLLSRLDPAGMVGKLFAIDRAALDDVGGFESLTDVLGEDMELSRRLSEKGRTVVAAPVLARSEAGGRTLRDTVARYARWIHVIRAQRPALLASYPLLFVATLPIVLLALAGAVASPKVGAAALLVAVGARLTVAVAARAASGRTASFAVVDAWAADLLLLAATVSAAFGRTVAWRGRRLAVGRGGRLRLVSTIASLILLLALPALALPKAGEAGINVHLEDADGNVIEMKSLVGKPILVVYEDKASSKMNQSLKDELSKLAKGDKFKGKIALAAVADLDGYDYWPVKGFVKDAIRKESKKIGATIFCDWAGGFRKAWGIKQGTSTVVVIDKEGFVLFSGEGKLSADDRKKVVDLLRKEVGINDG
jgi:ceramide glucosyltransferase